MYNQCHKPSGGIYHEDKNNWHFIRSYIIYYWYSIIGKIRI